MGLLNQDKGGLVNIRPTAMAGQARDISGLEPASSRDASRVATKAVLSLGSIVGAVLASSCCIVPFALFALGVSGAWISNLTALAPYQPLFAAVTVAFLVGGFVLVYRKPKAACAGGSYCASPRSDRIAKIGLWGATVLVAAALVLPYVMRLFITT